MQPFKFLAIISIIPILFQAKVIFVLSGYKNPERGDLREKALAMGAQYQPDWSPDSTHLM